MTNKQQTPGMTQLTAYLSRGFGKGGPPKAIPPEIRLMFRGMSEEFIQRISMEAASIMHRTPAEIHAVTRPLWVMINDLPEEPAEEPAEEQPKALPPEQAAALLWYIFDRYWYHVAQKVPGSTIHDDDERAIKAIRLMGWRTPEERNPPTMPVVS